MKNARGGSFAPQVWMAHELCWRVASFFQNQGHGACLVLKKREEDALQL
jgi:hypothetical protein